MPRTAAGAEDDAEDDIAPGGGAIGGLGQGEAIGVVGDADFAAEQSLQVLVEGMAVQGDGIGVFHQAGGGADAAGDADADAGRGADLGFRAMDEGGDIGEGFLVNPAGSGRAGAGLPALGR